MARDLDFEYNLDNLTCLMEEQEIGSRQGARPKKKSKKIMKTKISEDISPLTISSELELEHTRQENLKLQLEITKVQLEPPKISATNTAPSCTQVQNLPDFLHASPDLPLMNYLVASTPLTPGQANILNLETHWIYQKVSSTLSSHYIFSSKGMLELDQLSMSESVSGYLEDLKTQPELSKPCLLNHLQLLMDKATTYSWPSVRNFHQSVHNAVQNRCTLWADYEKIREFAQTFFTHLDLRAPGNMAHNTATLRSTRTKQNKSCETCNYTGECSCDQTQAIYKEHHHCRIFESADYPMLHSRKRNYPIQMLATAEKGMKQLPD